MELTGRSLYRIEIPAEQLERARCAHMPLMEMLYENDGQAALLDALRLKADSCRSCSVQWSYWDAHKRGELDWNVRVGSWGNLVTATVTGPAGQLAASRLIALVMGHRDPLSLVDSTI